jgi:hypothetical protein
MGNIKLWLEEMMEPDESIEAIVIGRNPGLPFVPKTLIGKVLTWKESRDLLDYAFDRGWGSANCNPVYIWTNSRIYFIHEYDGSTALHYIPRNAMNILPDYNGHSSISELSIEEE